MNQLLAGNWAPPPVTEAGPLAAWLLLGVAVASIVGSLLYAAGLALLRDKENSQLFWLITFGALFVFSFYVEPWMDVIGATTYMTNVFDPVVTIVDRPIPWHVVTAYVGGIGVAAMGAYLLIKNGRPARDLFAWAAFISITECVGEMVSCHYGVMLYYDNKALVFGVPLPSLVQNGGMFVLIGWAMINILPSLNGWQRVLVVPFIAPMVYLAYTLLCTLPSYYAIHNNASPSLSWALAIISTVLNLGAVLAAAYAPSVKRLRDKTSQPAAQHPTRPPVEVRA